MLRETLPTLVLGALLALSGCSTSDTMATAASKFQGDSLMSGLTGGLGLSETQAAGGLGSVMSLAGNKLPAADYASLSKLLPNADKYIKVAQEAGVLSDPITDSTKLNSAMGKLGIKPDTATNMLGQLGDYVGTAGGDSAKNMLTGLLK
jgi:Protein of unknown function VcgC/VcgE (DUF2780)